MIIIQQISIKKVLPNLCQVPFVFNFCAAKILVVFSFICSEGKTREYFINYMSIKLKNKYNSPVTQFTLSVYQDNANCSPLYDK